jgi:hypothetical protein
VENSVQATDATSYLSRRHNYEYTDFGIRYYKCQQRQQNIKTVLEYLGLSLYGKKLDSSLEMGAQQNIYN